MEIKVFDAHTHTQFAAFKNDYKDVIKRALDGGVGIINAGTNKKTSEDALKIAYEFSGFPVFASVGLHPLHSYDSYYDKEEIDKEDELNFENQFDFSFYKKLAMDKKVVGIGECGLDYFRINNEEKIKQKQKEIFLEQIKLSKDVKKPLIIHCRNAFFDIFDILNENRNFLLDPPGVMHFFTGDKKIAEEFINLGFYFTVGGVITFTRNYDEVIKFIPLDRILVETDAPYVAPAPYRGKRNEPSYVIEVVKKLSEIKNVSLERIFEELLKNTKKLFRI